MSRTKILIRQDRSTDGRAIAKATSVVKTSSAEPDSSTATNRGSGEADQRFHPSDEINQTVEVHAFTDHNHSYSHSSSRSSSRSSGSSSHVQA
ncbi:MAG: hypothetical protein HC881_10705 [Leptolyngbyaceae cyanobacterium SL_7_1]|nr:hypothetical protein [Leptolyngbyaceae cyanobacterium SL_7_1]